MTTIGPVSKKRTAPAVGGLFAFFSISGELLLRGPFFSGLDSQRGAFLAGIGFICLTLAALCQPLLSFFLSTEAQKAIISKKLLTLILLAACTGLVSETAFAVSGTRPLSSILLSYIVTYTGVYFSKSKGPRKKALVSIGAALWAIILGGYTLGAVLFSLIFTIIENRRLALILAALTASLLSLISPFYFLAPFSSVLLLLPEAKKGSILNIRS